MTAFGQLPFFIERYEFENSPWVQNLTQQDLAGLLGMSKTQLEAIVRDKENYIHRKVLDINGKKRDLAVPYGKLRTVHERLKYHLNKIKQPPYLFSPRKGKSQRDNAAHHINQNQFLSIDIREFYPSTSKEHIFRWAYYVAGLRSDVAGLITHLLNIDGKMPFGSSVSPILTTHVHRVMFDAIDAKCVARSLKMSLWVDDLVISGKEVPGELVDEIREIVRSNGIKSHKVRFRSGSRPVTITGVPIADGRVQAPRSLRNRIQNTYAELKTAQTDSDRCQLIDTLLSNLGAYRYHVGPSSLAGRKAADRMNRLRLRRSEFATYSVIIGPDLAASAAFDPLTNTHECPFEVLR